MLSERTGKHFQGLQQASRVLRKTSRLPDRLAKKMSNIDVAFNLIRHITSASVDSFVKELDAALPPWQMALSNQRLLLQLTIPAQSITTAALNQCLLQTPRQMLQIDRELQGFVAPTAQRTWFLQIP